MVVPDPSMVMATMISPHEVQQIQANLAVPHSKIPRIVSKSFVEFNPTDPNSSLVSVYRVGEERMVMTPFDAIFNDYDIYSQYLEAPPRTEQEWQRWAAKLRDLFNIETELGYSEDSVINLLQLVATARPNGPETRSFILRRNEVNEVRKALFIMTSLWNKDRKCHLMKKDPNFKPLNSRLKEWKRTYNLGRSKEAWVHNMVNLMQSQHNSSVRDMPEIYDLEKHDFHCNARERFMVFWEAGPNDEFVLTDNSFGGFEETELGGDPAINVDASQQQVAEKYYSKDHAWHQLFVLSPKLCMALCHGSYIDGAIKLEHQKRWGLKPSLLDSLPHGCSEVTFRDLTTEEATFLPQGQKQLIQKISNRFGVPNKFDGKVVALEMKDNDELNFEIQTLTSKQVHLVNTVLLQNQSGMNPVSEVCSRLRAAGQSLYESVQIFHSTEWSGRTQERRHNYQRLADYVRPPSIQKMSRRNTNPLMPLGPTGMMDDSISPPPTPSGFPLARPGPNPMQPRYPTTPPMLNGSHSTETVSTGRSERVRRQTQTLPPLVAVEGRPVPAAAVQHPRGHPHPHPQAHPHPHPHSQPQPQSHPQGERPRSTRNNTLLHTPPAHVPPPGSSKAPSERSYDSSHRQQSIESLENDLEEAQSRRYHATCLQDSKAREAGIKAADEEIRILEAKIEKANRVLVSEQEAERQAAVQLEDLARQSEHRARKLKEGEARQAQLRAEQMEQERLEKLRQEQEARAAFEEQKRLEELKQHEEEQKKKARLDKERQERQAAADAQLLREKEKLEAAKRAAAAEKEAEEAKRREQEAEREKVREQHRKEAEQREKMRAAMEAEKVRKEEAARKEEQKRANELEAQRRLEQLRQVESTRSHQVVHASRPPLAQSTSDIDPHERLRKLRREEQGRKGGAHSTEPVARQSNYRPPSVDEVRPKSAQPETTYRPNANHPLPPIPVDQSELSTVIDDDGITMISDSSSKASKVSSNKSDLHRVPSSKTSCSEHSDDEESGTVRDLGNMTGRHLNTGKPQYGNNDMNSIVAASMVANYDDESSDDDGSDNGVWETESGPKFVGAPTYPVAPGPQQYRHRAPVQAPLQSQMGMPQLAPSPHIRPGPVQRHSSRGPPVMRPRGRY